MMLNDRRKRINTYPICVITGALFGVSPQKEVYFPDTYPKPVVKLLPLL